MVTREECLEQKRAYMREYTREKRKDPEWVERQRQASRDSKRRRYQADPEYRKKHAQATKEWRIRNKERLAVYRKRQQPIYDWKRRILARLKQFMGCSFCQWTGNPASLCWHHVQCKSFSVNTVSNRSWDSIFRELDKCIVLCQNCHAELHFGQRWAHE